MRVITVCAAVTVAALGLSSCASTQPDETASPAPTADAVVLTILDADHPTVEGGVLDASELAGPVVLWFWAPWCVICRTEAPHMAELTDELDAANSPVTVLGVAGRGDLASMQGFVDDTGTDAMSHIADEQGVLWSHFGIVTQPAMVFISPDGQTDVVGGVLSQDQMRSTIDALEGA